MLPGNIAGKENSAVRRQLLVLTGLLVLVAAIAASVTGYTLAGTTQAELRRALRSLAKSDARLVATLFENARGQLSAGSSDEQVLQAALRVLQHSPALAGAPGQSSQIVLGQRQGEHIRRLLVRDAEGVHLEAPATDHPCGEPMRRAVAGHSGVRIDRDYRGVSVLAAYEPITPLSAGLVVKVDLEELQAPLAAAVWRAAVATLLVITAGLALFWRNFRPVSRRIEASEERLRGIVDSAAEGIVTLDDRRVVVEFNRAAEQLFGVSADEVVGNSLDRLLIRGADPLRVTEPGAPREVWLGRGPEGRQIFVEAAVSQIRVGPGRYWTVILSDISERRAAEASLIEAQAQLESRVEERTTELRESNRLLRAIAEVHDAYFSAPDIESLYEQILHNLLTLTAGPAGFVATIHQRDTAVVGCLLAGWDCLRDSHGRELYLDFNQLLEMVLPAASHTPVRVAGERLRAVHPSLERLLGLPLCLGDRCLGIAVVVNGVTADDPDWLDRLEPFVTTCAAILHDLDGRQQAERARAQALAAERELRGILTNMQDLVFRTDLAGRLTWVSAACESLLGYAVDVVVGRPFVDHLVDQELFSHLLAASQATGDGVRDFRMEVVTKSGESRWLSANCKIIQDPDSGEPIGIEGVARDITAYQQSQQEVATLNRLYSMLTHANRALVKMEEKALFYEELARIIVEIGGFRMVWIGELTEDRRGLRPVCQAGDVAAYPARLQTVGIDTDAGPVGTAIRERRAVIVQDVASSPQTVHWREPAIADGYRANAAFPFFKAGQVFGSINVYVDNPGYFTPDNVALLESLAADISYALAGLERDAQRAAATDHLRHLSEKLSLHIVNTPLAVLEFDPSYHIVDWNPAAEATFGYPSEAVIGRSADFLIAPESREEMAVMFRQLISGRGAGKHTAEHITRDGRRIICEWYSTELRAVDGRVIGLMSLARDITEMINFQREITTLNASLEARVVERTRELQAVNRELEAFSYSVSHDLRAPLRSIDGFGQLLLRRYNGSLGEPGNDYLQRIIRATQRMSELIDNMLRLSRVTRSELRITQVDLAKMAVELVDELRQSDPGHVVHVSVQPRLIVSGDRVLLRVVLQNLLGNAWKFTRKRADARIEFGRLESDGRTLLFVKDNGAGFDMAYAGKLFGAFQRLHGPEEFEGTGIGLATVQRIIHRHGGTVWGEAEPEAGAVFYFTLPGMPGGAEQDGKRAEKAADLAG